MLKKRQIAWKINNYHLYILIGVYFALSVTQIGLPEQLEGTRQVLTMIQLVMLAAASLLIVINLVKNWE